MAMQPAAQAPHPAPQAQQPAPQAPQLGFTVHGRDATDVRARESSRQVAAGHRLNSGRELGDFDRVENLVWIKQNTLYKEALEDWERQTKLVGERLDRREKRSQELNNQIYNVVGFFSVFQGVILTAVSQLSAQSPPTVPSCPNCPSCSGPCGKVWFPVVLSGLAAIAAVAGIWLKFNDLRSTDQLILIDKQEQRETLRREKQLRQQGENFFFKDLEDRKPSRLKSTYWHLKSALVIGAVIAFSVVFILSYFAILCDKWVIKGWN